MRRSLLSLLVLPLLLASCGDDSNGDDADPDPPPDETTTTAEADDPNGNDMPGEPIDIYPYEGATLAVVGVEADDTLNVRSGPGTDFDVLFELEPTATDFSATGHNRSLEDGAIWVHLAADEGTGWANAAFLLEPGETDDITSEVLPDLDDPPIYETMVDMANDIADSRIGEDAEVEPDVVVVDGPVVKDRTGEITVDVIGFPDDSVGGERLRIFADAASGGDEFNLHRVEAMLLCRRGVTDDGLCL